MNERIRTVSDAERELLRDYARTIADDLGLRDWAITVDDGGTDHPDHAAEMFADYGSKRLRLSFRHDFFTFEDDASRRATIVHELLHAHLEPLDWYLLKTLPGLLGSSTWPAVREAIRQHLETAIDGVAEAIAPRFPLIPALTSQEEND